MNNRDFLTKRETTPRENALVRLIEIAKKDTGQSRLVANFLLAWWNADECGGFDLTDIWGVDTAVATDMLNVFTLAAVAHCYPDRLGYEDDFIAIVSIWRPELVDHSGNA